MLLALLGSALAIGSSNRAVAFQAATPAANEPAASPIASPAAPAAVESADQVFVSGAWRVDVVLAQQASSFPNFKLNAADGKAWLVVVVADVVNFSSKDAKLDPKAFGAQAAGSASSVGLAPSSTKRIAKQLNVQPANPDAGITVAHGVSERLVLAFQIDATGLGYSLVLEGVKMPLAASTAQNRAFDALPDSAPLPILTPETYSSAVSGSSVKLKSGTRTLAGVDAPAGTECFSAEGDRADQKIGQGQEPLERTGRVRRHFSLDRAKRWHKDAVERRADRRWIRRRRAGADRGLCQLVDRGRDERAGGRRRARASCTSQHGPTRLATADTTAIKANSDGKIRSYVAWIAYPPRIVTTPDGGSWIFTAPNRRAGPTAPASACSRLTFDPAVGKWSDGIPMPGGNFEMGASAVVDSAGMVHLVYSDQAKPVELRGVDVHP